MIGKLTGHIDHIDQNHIILDVQGVGYVVTASARTLRMVGKPPALVSLLIETHVREDAIALYGFATSLEKAWFNLLITVQGVGAKVALAILGALTPDQLLAAITAQDKTALTVAEGVGPKLALRLVTELKDKTVQLLSAQHFMEKPISTINAPIPQPHSPPDELNETAAPSQPPDKISASDIEQTGKISADALSALINLGYKRMEAFAAITVASQKLTHDFSLNALIIASLAELARKDNVA